MSEAGGRRRVRRQRKVPSGEDAGGVRSSIDSVDDAVGEEKGESKDDAKSLGKSVPRVRISTEVDGNVENNEGKSAEVDEAARESTITPRQASPKKEKPPVTPTTDSRENEKSAVDRSKGRMLPNTIPNMII